MLTGCKVKKEDVEDMAYTSGKFDLTGALALVMFLASVILGLSLGKYAPFGSLRNYLLFGIALISLAVLGINIAKKKNTAIIPAPVLKDRNTLCLTLSNFFTNFSTMAIYFFLPMYVLYVMKQPPAAAGLTTSMYSVAGLFMGPVIGKIIGKSGTARGVNILLNGILRGVIAILFIFLLSPSIPIIIVYILMFISGFYGVVGGVTPAVAPQIQLKAEIRQLGNSVIQIGQNFGSSIGIAIYTAIITVLGPAKGLPVGLWLAAGCSLMIVAVSLPLKKLETAVK